MERKPTGPDLFAEIMEAEKEGRSWEAYPTDHPAEPARQAEVETLSAEASETAEEIPEVQAAAQTVMQRIRSFRWRKLSARSKRLLLYGLICAVLLYFFPVYRVVTVITGEYFEPEEVKVLYFRGTPWDLWEAREIMALGHAAFQDRTTPCNQYGEDDPRRALHGELWRHVSGPDPHLGKYTLKLLSAHLGKDNGYVWIEYSQEKLDERGKYIPGSDYKYQELWIVERDAQGAWQVVDAKWHP